MFAIAIAVVLGAVFYGLNNSTINQAGTSSTAQNTSQSTAPAAPRANTDQGMTTGAAPARPQAPPSSAPSGPDVNRSGNPPASK
jgi:cell division septation protein DedD